MYEVISLRALDVIIAPTDAIMTAMKGVTHVTDSLDCLQVQCPVPYCDRWPKLDSGRRDHRFESRHTLRLGSHRLFRNSERH